MTYHYFHRVDSLKNRPPKQKKPPKQRYKGKIVLVTTQEQPRPMAMGAEEAQRQLARSKGAKALHAKNKAYKWTSETARAAAKKLWQTRWRFNKRVGVRIGMPRTRAPRVVRAKVRAAHATPSLMGGVYFDAQRGQWFAHDLQHVEQQVSERTALRRLGYLKHNRKGRLPLTITPVTRWADGMRDAVSATDSDSQKEQRHDERNEDGDQQSA